MEPFPFEKLPIELKIKIIRFAIPSVTVYAATSLPPEYEVGSFKRRYGKELSRVRASCPEIKAICDRIRYLVVFYRGKEVYRLDPLRDTFLVYEPVQLLDFIKRRHEPRLEPCLQKGLPIRYMLCQIVWPGNSRGDPAGESLGENGEQTYAQLPFDSSLPIWPRTPMLKEFTLILAMCDRNWHIESFQQYGPRFTGWRPSDNLSGVGGNYTIAEGYDRFESADSQRPQSDTGIRWKFSTTISSLNYPGDPAGGAFWPDVPMIGFHGYSRGDMSQGGKWAGFRYWTETNKLEFRPLSWPEVQPCIEDYQRTSVRHNHPGFFARLWVNRPKEPIDVEQSQYGWIEVKAPEEGDAPWVEQVATTWKMVRYTLMRMNEAMDLEWHLENE
ncbi:hypothetical protein H9Q70_012221 [Fusarium xylarioides]|nr:hypothetical protein H9Q70_012221 [Fusarium xylarioides]KAG5783410.1 hypothetical protein H9Q73_002959 [Fusarium xylarioides]KAG5811402.1 hypothetical protein H9Q71_004907 [Fusarium xylarioides]KAG5824820.1 hypothetical protein H9Q74_005094 [Fusarium xylarioides]